MQKETHILIATRGILNDQVVVEKIEITSEDNMFTEDEFEDFGEYADYVLQEAVAEHEQRFSSAFVVKEEQLDSLIESLKSMK